MQQRLRLPRDWLEWLFLLGWLFLLFVVWMILSGIAAVIRLTIGLYLLVEWLRS